MKRIITSLSISLLPLLAKADFVVNPAQDTGFVYNGGYNGGYNEGWASASNADSLAALLIVGLVVYFLFFRNK